MTIGYHAPAAGLHTGVADYAERLRAALSRIGRVELGAAEADVHLYHLGNNHLHGQIYARALQTPGVIVLHDAVLHHFFLGTLSKEQYLAEWTYNYGVWRIDLAEELWRGRARAAVDPRYFEFPMLRRVVERSNRIIVHNSGAAGIVRAAVHSAAPVDVIPHFSEVQELPEPIETACFRERLGIGLDITLFGIFGYLREPKRVLPCIETFKKLHAVRPKTALLLAGEAVSGDLERLLSKEPAHAAIFRADRLNAPDFRIAAAAVDCGLNLRFPGAGESSGVGVTLMELSKPVIVTDNAENSAFPPEAVLRVMPGVAEAAELFEHMLLVTEFPDVAREIGSAARLHIRRHHSLDAVARKYWEVLCSALSSVS